MVRCAVCDDVITQPLCGACLAQEISSWLEEDTAPELVRELRLTIEESLAPFGETTCIKCGAKMGVCNYCVLSLADEWLAQHLPLKRAQFRELFGLHPRLSVVEPPHLKVMV